MGSRASLAWASTPCGMASLRFHQLAFECEETMMSDKAASSRKAATVVANDLDDLKGELKHIGGSRAVHWDLLQAVN
jgi:hypothetical protein